MKKLLLLFITLTTTFMSSAQDFSCEGINYTVIDENAHTCCTKAGTSYSDPGNPNLTGPLSIPESVEYNGVSYTVTEIGVYSFLNCTGLYGSLSIPKTVNRIGANAFYGCNGFKGTLTIPNSVTSIGAAAFYGCSGFTGTLNIPNSVTSIGICAFEGCSGFTGSLTIPNSITSVGYATFCNCSGFNGDLIIPNSVIAIGEAAFAGCKRLSGTLSIPHSVTSIGASAFSECNGLTGSLSIPSSVKTIGEWAFEACNGFNGALILPNSLTSIGNRAFYRCESFTQVEYRTATPITATKDIFSDAIYANAKLVVTPDGVDKARSTEPWMYFNDIEAMDLTAIDDILGDIDPSVSVEVYNLNGVKVADSLDSLPTGIYIVRQGSKVSKVAVR